MMSGDMCIILFYRNKRVFGKSDRELERMDKRNDAGYGIDRR